MDDLNFEKIYDKLRVEMNLSDVIILFSIICGRMVILNNKMFVIFGLMILQVSSRQCHDTCKIPYIRQLLDCYVGKGEHKYYYSSALHECIYIPIQFDCTGHPNLFDTRDNCMEYCSSC